MPSLSKKEAKNIIKDILPIIREKIDMSESASISIAGMEKAFIPVQREGNTPDVYCKIAEAASEHGLSTDIQPSLYNGIVLRFWPTKPGYKKPSPEICDARWKEAKKISELIQKEGEQKFLQKYPEYLE
jgi:hypothetical protein